jgi:hypothetical protein
MRGDHAIKLSKQSNLLFIAPIGSPRSTHGWSGILALGSAELDAYVAAQQRPRDAVQGSPVPATVFNQDD